MNDTIRDIHSSLGLKGKLSFQKADGMGREAQPLKDAGLKAAGLVVDSLGYGHRDVRHRPEDTPDTVPLDCLENNSCCSESCWRGLRNSDC